MKLPFLSFLLSLFFSTTAAASWEPTRIDWASLQEEDDTATEDLRQALQTVGMISLTGLNLDTDWKASYARCVVHEHEKEEDSVTLQATLLASHHRRSTYALSSEDEEELVQDFPSSSACQRFHAHDAVALRDRVDEVLVSTTALWKSLMPHDHQILETSRTAAPMLTIQETMKQALVLEHFHAYQQEEMVVGASSSPNEELTLDWHVDQGMFLAFVPGTTLGKELQDDELWIQLPDGRQTPVHLDPTVDELILMVGDGVTTILNPHLETGFRPLPHALQLSTTPDHNDHTRVWYGRMMLPPSHAYPPATDDTAATERMTYGEWRQQLMNHHHDESSLAPAGLGCSGSSSSSSSTVSTFIHPAFRQLQVEDDCNPALQAWCWNRCMNYTDYDASPEICTSNTDERNLLGCSSEDGDIWDGAEHNPIYRLDCLSATQIEAALEESDDEETKEEEDHASHDHADHDHDLDHDDKSEAASIMRTTAFFFLVSSGSFLVSFLMDF